MKLTGLQQRRLTEALIDGFATHPLLNELSTFFLNVPLNRIVANTSTLDEAALALVVRAASQDLVSELFIGALEMAPRNALVRRALDSLGVDEGATAFERIVLKTVPIVDPDAWRAEMIRCEKAVCRVETADGVGIATAFLVGADIVATNNHVIANLGRSRSAQASFRFRFDYHILPDSSQVHPGSLYSLHQDTPVLQAGTSGALDFAILRLSAPAGDEPGALDPSRKPRGWLRPVEHVFQQSEPLSIIQHPGGSSRKFAFGSVCDPRIGSSHVGYKVNTEPGSSGSPCFTHDWSTVAIHFSGAEDDGFNKGVTWTSILTALSPALKSAILNGRS